jgi:hypothetical protein
VCVCMIVYHRTCVFVEDTSYYAKLGLHRLRMLLAVPAIPRSYAESSHQRQFMIRDLYAFGNSLRSDNYTISLEVWNVCGLVCVWCVCVCAYAGVTYVCVCVCVCV